jgi:uncharacterized protein (DUF1697 family)
MTPKTTELSVAFLRGINVGGKNLLPMNSLAAIFSSAGCTAVRTYIQSGNVIFHHLGHPNLPACVRAEIDSRFNLKVPVIVRTASELRRAIAANPLLKAGEDTTPLHVMFLETAPTREQIASLDPARSAPDRFAIVGSEIYLHLPNGAAKTKLTNAYFDAKLKTVSTQRNWRTVLTLAELMEQTVS